jgi:hypothetical protein
MFNGGVLHEAGVGQIIGGRPPSESHLAVNCVTDQLYELNKPKIKTIIIQREATIIYIYFFFQAEALFPDRSGLLVAARENKRALA